ncbi:MAG TPA: adenylate/guanylate cyclase domain-containing protein [Candidatus Limnocylindria bacterium]|jgi:class 3 adenylate cyclase/tetratricopeptide (TPR) repeat protein|nr:adenylate/guanylate cyclase domain-containing protein [Candidatus Limnocylindria bacterium]
MERRSERRLVTCVFVDIVQSTDMTERLGPERMRRVLGEAFAAISRVALSEGGTIEKYIGDEVFILFGAPVTHADDVKRALRVADACARIASPAHAAVAVRIGLETGEALIDLAALEDRQRMAVGTCVNVAARLQQQAEAGQVLVGPTCHTAAGGFAEFEDLGSLDLKGLGKVPAWRLVRVAEGTEAALAFVGRRTELARLRDAFDRARGGHATLALVMGEAGIGKSRLVEEFARSIADEAGLLSARIRPGTEVGASPLQQLIADPRDASVPDAVAHSAGLRTDPRLVALPLIDRRNEIEVAWRGYLAALARERPIVLWLEDVHWAESELVRLVDRLTFASDTPLLVIATARPEFPAMTALRPSPDRQIIDLAPLDAEAATALAQAAGAREAPRVARAGGHPLFIVELVRARGALGAELPVSVQAAIGARLDELAQADRDLLQRAAVVGETFQVRDAALLAELDPADAAGMLGRLTHLRYVDRVDGAFRFHHALVRDVAYARLPVSLRARLHARYAREGLEPDQAETLAHHWWEALGAGDAEWIWEGDPEFDAMRAEALRTHLAAGRSLADRMALDRAFEVYERALKLARDPRDSAGVEEAFAQALARNAQGDAATQHRLRAIELHRSAGGPVPAKLFADTLDLAVFNWGYFKDLPSAEQVVALLDEGSRIARETVDTMALVRLLAQRGFFTNDATVLAETGPLLEAIADKRPYGDALWRLALVQLATNGDCAQAVDLLDLVQELADHGAELNEPEALAWQTLALFHAGDLARAERTADRLLEISATKSAHTLQHALAAKSLVPFARGDWGGVAELAAQLRSVVEQNPDASFCLFGANLAGYEAIGDALRGRPLRSDLTSLTERLLPKATATRAAALLLPMIMAGDPPSEEEARRAYSSGTGLWNRESVWDIAGMNLAIAQVMRRRWREAERELPRMDRLGERGAAFASALASAIREEIASANGGPKPTHETLRALGYRGVSELLSYRVPSAREAAIR